MKKRSSKNSTRKKNLPISRVTYDFNLTPKVISTTWARLDTMHNVVTLTCPFPLEKQESLYGGFIQCAPENKISDYIIRTNQTLDSYTGPQSIDELKIDIPSVEGAHFEKWLIKFALSREIETLDIHMVYCKKNIDWTDYISPLLSLMREKDRQSLPGLNHLKELSLRGVTLDYPRYDGYDYEVGIQILLSNLVFLERLSIESPKTLGYIVLSYCKLNIFNFAKVEEIRVCGMINLVSLRCHGLEKYDLYVDRVPSLVHLDVFNSRRNRVAGILPGISYRVYEQLLRLELELELRRGTCNEMSYTYMPPTILAKLKLMKLNVKIEHECSIHHLFPLIGACSSMEELEIKFLWSTRQTCKHRRLDQDRIKTMAAIKKLETVRLLGYFGSVSELEFVLYAFNNATNLKELIVEASDKNHVAQPNQIARAFQKLLCVTPSYVDFIIL